MVSEAPPDRLDTDRLMAWSSECIQLQLELSRAPHMSSDPFHVFSSDNVLFALDHTFENETPPWGFLKIKPPLDFPFQKERHNVRVIEDLC